MRTVKIAAAIFIALSFFSSCTKDSSGGGTTTPPLIYYYFKGTLNGQALNWDVTNGTTGWINGSASSLTNTNGQITGSLTALLSAAGSFEPQLGFEFETFNVLPVDDESVIFNNFIQVGAFSYATASGFAVGTKALIITYTDGQGNKYTSVGAQTGSSLNIVSVTQIPATIGTNESLRINLTFSCTLYPVSGTGASLTITNATASVLLVDLL
jgi:hypothetical protein